MIPCRNYGEILNLITIIPQTAKEEKKIIKRLNKLGIEYISIKFDENKKIVQKPTPYE